MSTPSRSPLLLGSEGRSRPRTPHAEHQDACVSLAISVIDGVIGHRARTEAGRVMSCHAMRERLRPERRSEEVEGRGRNTHRSLARISSSSKSRRKTPRSVEVGAATAADGDMQKLNGVIRIRVRVGCTDHARVWESGKRASAVGWEARPSARRQATQGRDRCTRNCVAL